MLYINTVSAMTAPSAALHSSSAGAVAADPAGPARRLLDALRERLRYLHHSIRTEEAYVHWVRAFVRFHGLRLPWMNAMERPQRKPRLPVVLSAGEVRAVLALLGGTHGVLAQLLYGTGMRITEALQLHVKDVDFERRVIVARSGKGGKDRVVMLPAALAPALKPQLQRAHVLWQADARDGRGGVQLPDALGRKYPRAGASWGWFWLRPLTLDLAGAKSAFAAVALRLLWVFAQAEHSVCPRSRVRRHHGFDQTFQRAFKRAVQCAGITRPATPHTLRHAFATRLLQSGTDFGFGRCASRGLRPHEPAPQLHVARCRTVQKLLGRSDVSTTMIHTHVLEVTGGAVRSPLDALLPA